MSTITHGSYQGSVVIEDDDGLVLVPLHDLRTLIARAEVNQSQTTRVDGRSVHRDSLMWADATARQVGLAELPSCVRCVDGPAVTTDHRDKPVCLHHAPED